MSLPAASANQAEIWARAKGSAVVLTKPTVWENAIPSGRGGLYFGPSTVRIWSGNSMPKFIVDSVADGLVTLVVPGTNYENTFKLEAGKVAAGDRVRGTIHAPAWKAETVSEGGNYVEPLLGRP